MFGMKAGVQMGSIYTKTAAASGGGGFTAFSDDFSGTLAKWSEVGTGAIVAGKWSVTNTIAAIWADYEMPTGEGSWDITVTLAWSDFFEVQIPIFANTTLASVADPYRINNASAKGYLVRITSGAIDLCKIDTTQGAHGGTGSYTGAIASGSVVIVRVAFNGSGDLSVEILDDGATKGTITIAAASVLAGIGTSFGIVHGAFSGSTSTADDVSFDVTP